MEQALKKAEEARKEAQRKLDQRKAETLRAQLEKIRLDQTEQVNKPTTAIEKSRKPDGSLTRENAVVLNQLPGKEGDLSKRTGELRDALRELGGVVYDEAAKEVGEGMNDIKEDLGKQKTAQLTQLAEARVIEQLDAMIDSLKQEKDFSKFNQKQNGGGGQGSGGGSKLPTEAELRLLKAMQLAVNKNTKAADALPKPQQDKPGLLALGNRKGSLRSSRCHTIPLASPASCSPNPSPASSLASSRDTPPSPTTSRTPRRIPPSTPAAAATPISPKRTTKPPRNGATSVRACATPSS